jgi:hypothetical protein
MLMMWPLPVSAMKAMPEAGCQLIVHSLCQSLSSIALSMALSASIVPLTAWQGCQMGCLAVSVKTLAQK